MTSRNITDPLEKLVADALTAGDVEFVHESEDNTLTCGLDFWVRKWDTYIEVKQYHSPRIALQMERATNVIALQGRRAVNTFVVMMRYRSIAMADRDLSDPGAG